MKSQQVRQQFLDFFASKGHQIVPSAPMVLKNDPTLMFTNAGMVPFKEYFLGQKQATDPRIADTQKCLRVSGKHNDLDEVGKDTYHHTMFEMLGNWSFGDYFKKEAIDWAWELLTEVYKIDKDSLYVTVFEGSEEEGLAYDNEAYTFWKTHLSEDRILTGNKKDNFWEMGAQGPCGPCSEIHVDIRSEVEKSRVPGKELVNRDHPQVVEIWNLVFIEFNRKADGSLEQLPEQHVDTGMGFERLCMVLQGKQSNYDTDVFTPLINKVASITDVPYGKNEDNDIAIRVIADHVRAVGFAIADGQLPSNNGAGYVIRRILRRAIRYGFTFLEVKRPFIYELVATLTHEMGSYFPELKTQEQLIVNVIKEEEHSFLRTLDQGLVRLEVIIKESDSTEISGKKAFELYDTYGFPFDLTALILEEKNLTVNEGEFELELNKQKDRSRAAAQVETDDWVVLNKDTTVAFIGYDQLESTVHINRYRKVTSKKDGDLYQLVFDTTPFYPEGGGQVGDSGYLKTASGKTIAIVNTKKENNLIIHFAKNLPADPRQELTAVVQRQLRANTARNHTASHLLHQALREVLGTHVEQKGSAVYPKNLRFDFSHFAKMTPEELKAVEDFVNARIDRNIPLQEYRSIPMEEAMDKGAIALFGEKYDAHVRAIQFGDSIELCGGTHVQNTADIWHFKITAEGAIAAGIRRIEAITGDEMKAYYANTDTAYTQVRNQLKNPKDTLKSVTDL
jgi:alanyl-tRNA synthetase